MSRLTTLCIATVSACAIALPALAQEFEIPQPLKAGHHELYSRLEKASGVAGETGEAAQAALDALKGHFEKEETYALPQLGVLETLAGMPGAEGRELSAEEKQELIARTDRFRSELPQMLEEHRKIAAALESLQATARAAGNDEIARLAGEIMTHADTEEQVLYPAALLIGEYLEATGEAK